MAPQGRASAAAGVTQQATPSHSTSWTLATEALGAGPSAFSPGSLQGAPGCTEWPRACCPLTQARDRQLGAAQPSSSFWGWAPPASVGGLAGTECILQAGPRAEKGLGRSWIPAHFTPFTSSAQCRQQGGWERETSSGHEAPSGLRVPACGVPPSPCPRPALPLLLSPLSGLPRWPVRVTRTVREETRLGVLGLQGCHRKCTGKSARRSSVTQKTSSGVHSTKLACGFES